MSLLLLPGISRPLLLIAGSFCTIALVRAAVARRKRNPRGLPLPPGPKGLPILGNALQFPDPDQYPEQTFHKLCSEYGGIVYLTAMGQGFLVLDTLTHANELLDKRAAIYSDRPVIPALDLIEQPKWSFGAMRYGSMWRNYRRVFHQSLHSNRVAQYHPIMDEQRDDLLRKLRDHPKAFLEHINMYFGKAIMRTAYGIDDVDRNESFIHDAEFIIDGMGEALRPGRYLVNLLPFLRYVPEWVPGAGFQKTFREYVEKSEKSVAMPYEEAKTSLIQGKRSVHPSMAASLIDTLPDENAPNRKEMEDLTKHVCATAYIAGADTSVASATALVLALASHPDVQKKAQAELDAVIGTDRSPLVSDRPALPYLEAIVKELGRWHTVGALGITHATSEDDEYQGYFIPKGTFIIPNTWAIMHDKDLFERPFDFVPERYLKDGKIDPSVPDPEVAAFGFGRRICPGRHFSNDAVFLLAASLLANYDIYPSKDAAGNPVKLKLEVMSQLVAKPLPYECEFVLRKGRETQSCDPYLSEVESTSHSLGVKMPRLQLPQGQRQEYDSYLLFFNEIVYATPIRRLISKPVLALAGCICAIVLVQVVAARRRRNPRRLPLPPGPKGLPVIGNAHQVPAPDKYPWKVYHELCKEYGGMVYQTAMGQGILVLGTLTHAMELLDKRAATYSDRPYIPAVELTEHPNWAFGAMPYGSQWRNYRRAFHQNLHHNRVAQFHPIMSEQRDDFLRKLKERPTEFLEHVKMYFGKTIMRTSYGIDDMNQNELFIRNAESILDGFAAATTPGKYLVNIFPFLKHVPEWVPGAAFKKTFRKVVEVSETAVAIPFGEAKAGLVQGKGSVHPSIAASLIEGLPDEGVPNRKELENLAKHVCATAYIAGADTSVSSATALLLVLATHPDVQKKAQDEIDAVIGADRLPLVTDRPSLPYLEAVLKEVGRWYTVAPLGLSHATTADDEYGGYFIPKGTLVIANSWAILHDENIFDRPFDFVPERYLKDGKIDPSVLDHEVAAFGFGRRICPGRHFSNDAIFLLAASLLANFDIAPPKDDAGNPIELKLAVISNLVARPLPFKCEFTLRKGREL
ncbi:hypothetical protein NMY22_g12499 [Coprinellus aureogranulatus]|nr:hypothetical protein NMY22_g12499 [Coprinellus aureogranulatus]